MIEENISSSLAGFSPDAKENIWTLRDSFLLRRVPLAILWRMPFQRYFIRSPQDRWELYSSLFDAQQDLWVVSHLRAKESLRHLVLQQKNSFADHAHRRMQEWIKDLFEIIYSEELRWVDGEFLRLWLHHLSGSSAVELSPQDEELRKQLGPFIAHWGADTLMRWMTFLGPLSLEARGDQGRSLSEFLSSRPESERRWGEVYRLSLSLARWIYTQKKWVLSAWFPHLLAEWLRSHEFKLPFRRVFFDLGLSLRHSEAEWIKELSRCDSEVIVLEPELRLPSPWNQAGYKRAYDIFSSLGQAKPWAPSGNHGAPQQNESLSWEELGQNTATYDFVTQTSALQDMAKLSSHILEREPAARIIWLFPDVESVLPYLVHLRQDHEIPLRLRNYHRISELAIVQRFIRRLRFFENSFTWMDIERQLGDTQAKYNYFYLQHDYELKPSHFQSLEQERQAKSHLRFSWDEFVDWLFSQIDHPSLFPPVQRLMTSWSEKVDLRERWPLSSWLRLMERVSYQSAYKSMRLEEFEKMDDSKIEVLSYEEWSFEAADYIFCFGANLEELRSSGAAVNIPVQDLDAIHRELGYFVDHPFYSEREFQFYLALQYARGKKILIRSHYLQDQRATTPHPLHLILRELRQDSQSEIKALQEEINGQSSAHEKSFIAELIKNPSVTAEEPTVPWDPERAWVTWPMRMNASQLETFLYCGFRYWAERSLSLKPFLARPFEVESAVEGTIFHKLFENILKNLGEEKMGRTPMKTEEMGNLIQKLLVSYEADLPQHQKEILQRSLLDVGLRFLDQHRDWFRCYPQVETALLEEPVELYLDMRARQVRVEKPEHHYYLHVRGQIDRVDVVPLPTLGTSESAYAFVVVDYKRSTATKHGWKQWPQQAYYQLFLYALALEQSEKLSHLYGNKKWFWMGAHFYNYKKLQYEKGFLLGELAGVYQDQARPSRALVYYDSEEWREYRENLEKSLFDQLERALQSPSYERLRWDQRKQDCTKCSWSWACRQEQISLFPTS